MDKYLSYLNTIGIYLIFIAIIVIGIFLLERSSGVDFTRYENYDLNIVCYVQGISCLPLN